jgi:chorismate mutase
LSTMPLCNVKEVRGLRGATTAESDERAAVLFATEELLSAMLGRNAVAPDDIISILFTATPDVTAEFPAAAARKMGLVDVPLMCAVEMNVRGAVTRCIRVLMHVATTRSRAQLEDAYLRGAADLR